jgi:hypothetical protein
VARFGVSGSSWASEILVEGEAEDSQEDQPDRGYRLVLEPLQPKHAYQYLVLAGRGLCRPTSRSWEFADCGIVLGGSGILIV